MGMLKMWKWAKLSTLIAKKPSSSLSKVSKIIKQQGDGHSFVLNMANNRMHSYENEFQLNRTKLLIIASILLFTGSLLDSVVLYENYLEREETRKLIDSLNFDPADIVDDDEEIDQIPTVQKSAPQNKKQKVEIPDLFKYNS